LSGDGDRDEEDDELREDEDLEETERERRLGDGLTMAKDDVSCPAICISLACSPETVAVFLSTKGLTSFFGSGSRR